MSEETLDIIDAPQIIHNESVMEDKFETKSMVRIVTEQFLEHRMAVFGLIIIGFFATISIMAPVISSVLKIDPDGQNVFHRYAKPFSTIPYDSDKVESKIQLFVEQNLTSAKTIIYQMTVAQLIEAEDELDQNGIIDLLIETNSNMQETDYLNKLKALNNEAVNSFIKLSKTFVSFHVLGTDELGRDVLLRLVYGARVSIGVGLLVAFASALIGLFIGCIAGYYGGFIDSILMRVTDSLLSLPLLPVLIVFAAVDLKKIAFFDGLIGGENESIFKLVFILCIFSWMTVARLVRGSTLAIKEREFIDAAKTIGARDYLIIIKHVIPNIVAPLLVAITLNVGQSILSEAALSFLGLGIQPPIPSWGNMLFNAQELIYEAPFLAIIPGLLILMVVISFNFVGDGLQDAIDPKGIKR